VGPEGGEIHQSEIDVQWSHKRRNSEKEVVREEVWGQWKLGALGGSRHSIPKRQEKGGGGIKS